MGVRTAALVTVIAVGGTMLGAQASTAAPIGPAGAAISTKVQLNVVDKRINPGQPVVLKARLVRSGNGTGVGGEELTLQYRKQGLSGWRTGSTKTTAPGGRVEWSVNVRASTRFRVVHPASPGFSASRSDVRHVELKPKLSIDVRRDWVRPDGSVKVKGKVTPAFSNELVSLQLRSNGHWRTVKRKRQGEHGRVNFSVSGRADYGPTKYRLYLEKRDAHLAAASKRATVTTVRLVTYRIETRGRIVVSMKSFRERAAEIYADKRGWSRAYVRFKRVKSGGAFSLVLSQARYVPSFGEVCDRYWSCRVGRYVIINQNRWRWGTPYFKRAGGSIRQYRAMVVNHETGHWFGLGHASCGGKGQLAPVMMQQSKGLYGCKPNPWPLRWEVKRAY